MIKTGDILVNLDAKTVEVNGLRVHLTGKECQMLELLSLRKEHHMTKEMFLNHLYGGMDEPELKIIDVFCICKLRKEAGRGRRGQAHIETVWGRGYVLPPGPSGSRGLGRRLTTLSSDEAALKRPPSPAGVFVLATTVWVPPSARSGGRPLGRLLALVAALIAALLIAWGAERTPRTTPSNAPATTFSARQRAMADVVAIGSDSAPDRVRGQPRRPRPPPRAHDRARA